MNWSWHAFTIARIPIRLHWTLLFVVAYHVLRPRASDEAIWILFLSLALVMHFAIILFHELGHSWAARRAGGHVDQILLWPLGGFAYVGHSDEPRTDMFVAVCGPATHLVLGGLAGAGVFLLNLPWDWSYVNPLGAPLLYGDSLPEWLVVAALHVNVTLFAFNLFVPAYPLDGGRILLDFLRMRMGDWRASRTAGTISMVIGVLLLMTAILNGNLFLGLISVLVIMQAMQLRSVAPDDAYSPHGYSDRGYRYEEPRKEGYFAKRRREKRERALARRDAEVAELRARVDELLDKVNRGGIGSLTPAERKSLEEASERLRRNG